MRLSAPSGYQRDIGGTWHRRGFIPRRAPPNIAWLDNLIAWWPLVERQGTRADVHGGFTLTDSGGVTIDQGVACLANGFEAAGSQFLYRPDQAEFRIGGRQLFAISAWVYLTDKSADRTIVAKNNTTANDREFILYYVAATDRFKFNIYTAGTGSPNAQAIANTFGSPALNTWHFVCAWYDGTSVSISVNGGAVDSVAKIATRDGNSRLCIGATNEGATGYMAGRIMRVGLWVRISQDGINRLYNGGFGCDYPFI